MFLTHKNSGFLWCFRKAGSSKNEGSTVLKAASNSHRVSIFQRRNGFFSKSECSHQPVLKDLPLESVKMALTCVVLIIVPYCEHCSASCREAVKFVLATPNTHPGKQSACRMHGHRDAGKNVACGNYFLVIIFGCSYKQKLLFSVRLCVLPTTWLNKVPSCIRQEGDALYVK